jgi:general secretion pathway protein F
VREPAWLTPGLRGRVWEGLWTLPAIGAQLRTLALAAAYRALGLLLTAGVPVPAAMDLVQDLVAPPLRPPLARAGQRVRDGLRLSEAFEHEGLSTPVAQRMLRVGEQSGELARMLESTAAFHDEEIERLSDWISRALTPLLMLAMGVVVGLIVVLMYLPIFTLMEQVQ